MKHSARDRQGSPFLDLLEESLHLLRSAPLSITLHFYFGTIPFVMGLLFFSMDFSQASYSDAEAALAALGLALLYAWMKTWQAIFCQQLRRWLCGSSSEPGKTGNFFSVFFQQLIVQPTSFIVVPLSLVIALPFGWTYAFYQNISVLGDGTEPSLKKLSSRAWLQASLWPKQNHMGIWLISPLLFVAASTLMLLMFYVFARVNPYWMHAPQAYFVLISLLLLAMGFIANPCGAVVTLNIGVALCLLPSLLKMLTGIETIFTLGPSYMLSATFLITVCSLTYLTLEPLVKAFYVLRCFYGDSIRTGEDLKAGMQALSLRQPVRITALLVFFLGVLPSASAQPASASPAPSPPSFSAEDFDRSIDRVMSERKYSWRNPGDAKTDSREKGMFGYFLDALADRLKETAKSLGEAIGKLMDWWDNLFKRKETDSRNHALLKPSDESWPAALQFTLWGLSALLVFLLIRSLLPRFRRKKTAPAPSYPAAAPKSPDLASDTVNAADLEADEWEVLGAKLMQEGEFRLALRAFFLSSLSFLGRKELLQLKRHKTNREYECELRRQIHSQPEILRCFSQNLALYERSWYGVYEATPEVLQLFTRNQYSIRQSLET